MVPVRLLIADDNRDYTAIFSELISLNSDIEVVGIAEDGKETIEMIKEKKPDVLLLDLVMPRTGGLEIMKEISGMKQNAPVVFVVSALGNESITRQALALGARYFFVKPLQVQSVVSRIREIFSDS